MIIRLMTAGQYRADDSLQTQLDELDDEAVTALDAGDEERLDTALARMWDLVQAHGQLLPEDSLETSDAIIPPPDLTLEETRELFSEHGLVPDLPA